MIEEKSMMSLEKNSVLEKVKDKIIYIVEFIATAIFMVFLYKLICTRKYDGEYARLYLILCNITAIFIGGAIIYTFVEKRDKIEEIFLSIAIPIGMAYLIFLIPGYAPDENAHLYRSYEVSKGILVTQVNEEDRIRSDVPVFFLENYFKTVEEYWKLNDVMKLETDYNNEEEVLSPAYSYSPTLYFPNAIMFLIGRIFSINGMIVIYLARIVNFIVFLICGYYTIKIIPFGKILMMTYMLIPMAIHQSVSLSADCITNAISLLFIAYALNLYFKEKITRKNKILYVILAVLVAIHKVAYFPIALISLIFLTNKNMDKKQKIKFVSIVILVGLIAGLVWVGVCSRGTKDADEYAITYNINAKEQLEYILKNPISYIKIVLDTIYKWIDSYYLHFIGHNLGWLNITIRRVVLDMYFILLLFSPFVEKHEKQLNKKSKIIFFLTFVIAVVAIFTALYIGNTGVGLRGIRGVQGRYFMPVVILALIVLCGKEKYIKTKNIEIIYPILIMLMNFRVVGYMIEYFL